MENSIEKILYDAARGNNIPLLQDLLNAGVSANMIVDTPWDCPQPPLFIAIQYSYIEMVKILLEYGANPNTLCSIVHKTKINTIHLLGRTHLLGAIEDGGIPVEERIEILRLLVMYGGDINSKDDYGDTLLHYLIYRNTCKLDELIYEIIRLGGDVNVKNKKGNTPLFYSCDDMNNYYLIPTLVKAGANINTVNNKGETIIVSLIKRLNDHKYARIKYYNATSDNWHEYMRYDYFLEGDVKRSHKKDLEIVIKMLMEHGARVDRYRSGEFLDKIKVIPDDVLGIIDSYIGQDPIDVAIGYGYMEAAEFIAGMRGIDLGEYKKRHRIV
jgi:ankyrin repeat protein